MTRLSDDSGDRMTGGCAAVGQAGGDPQQALLHQLAGAHQLGPLLEDHHDRRETEHRFRTERAQSGHAVHGVLERDGDQALDFARGEAWRFRLDLDQRRREFGKHVERGVLRRARPGDDQDERQRDNDEAQAERAFNEPPHHDGAYFPAPNSTPKSSAAPSVTTRAPAAGPCDSTARCPVISATTTRCRTYTRGSRTT